MEFVPEDGEGLSNSNSYLTEDRFIEISDLLGYDYSDITTAVIESTLVRSTFTIDSMYRGRFPGERQVTGQSLEWPRTGAFYVDGEGIAKSIVPKEIELSTVEMFYLINGGTSVQPVLSAQGNIREERIKVDVIEESKRYTATPSIKRDVLSSVEDALSRITGGISNLFDLKIRRSAGGS